MVDKLQRTHNGCDKQILRANMLDHWFREMLILSNHQKHWGKYNVKYTVVAFGLIPAIFYCTLFFFITAYFSRQSDTGTIDDVIWVWCSLSEKLLDLFNGNKTKNDWFFVQTFIRWNRKLEKLDLFSNQGNSRRIYNLADVFDSSIYQWSIVSHVQTFKL